MQTVLSHPLGITPWALAESDGTEVRNVSLFQIFSRVSDFVNDFA